MTRHKLSDNFTPNPYAFQFDSSGKALRPEQCVSMVWGRQQYSIYDLEHDEALALCRHYTNLAKKVKRLYRGKVQNVFFSLETLTALLKGLMFRSSELEEPVVESIQNLTGWEYCEIQSGLNALANNYIIERRLAVAPRQIVARW